MSMVKRFGLFVLKDGALVEAASMRWPTRAAAEQNAGSYAWMGELLILPVYGW